MLFYRFYSFINSKFTCPDSAKSVAYFKARFYNSQVVSYFNNFIQVWVQQKRSQNEPSFISNKENHRVNGNPPAHYFKSIFQNVPGKMSPQNIEIAIKAVLAKHEPGILGVAEPSYETLKTIHFSGYRLVRGKLTGGKKYRLNVLIKENLTDYTIETFTTVVPSILIKVAGHKLLHYYREWRLDGAEGTGHIKQQEENLY